MTQNDKPTRRAAGLWISGICMVLLIASLAAVGSGWAVRRAMLSTREADPAMSDRVKAEIMAVAMFPATARDTLRVLAGGLNNPFLSSRSDKEKPYWTRRFPAPEDSGYILYTGLYRGESSPGVKLIRIADGQVLASWTPDWGNIYSRLTKKKFQDDVDVSNIEATNPVLLDNGDVIFPTATGLVRQPACSRESAWVLDEIAHHSTDLDLDGESIWVPSVSKNAFEGNRRLRSFVRDDAIARFSLGGKLIDRRSMAAISNANDLDFLLFNGNKDNDFNRDPIHMNQIRVARMDSKFWQKGDLLVSLRNPNTVLLYRPSTNAVIWRQTGPWIHQHSADFVNDHQISVFNNNSVLKSPEEYAFLTPQSINQVMVYDFETNKITQPFKQLLEQARPRSIVAGRARLLPDGGLFLEETGNGRMLRFSRDRLVWSFVNDHDEKYIGALSDGSSYLTADEARKPLEALAARHCGAAGAGAAASAASPTPLSGS